MSENNPFPGPNQVPDALEQEGINDNDSALGSELASDTQTISSFITHYTWQNGRRYHADHIFNGHYWGPNDESANEQQQLTNHLWKLTLDNKLHLAPIGNPQNVLDLGTGAGTWALQVLLPQYHRYMANNLPVNLQMSVTGIDLSPVQPAFVPSNCYFEVADITMPWTWPVNSFDFIHIRELFGSIADWNYLLSQSLNVMKPGGWIEVLEHSVHAVSDYGTCGEDAFFTKWGKIAEELGKKTGASYSVWSETKGFVEKAGFIDVVEQRFKWPMNGWSKNKKLKELGMWNQLRLFNGVEDFMLRPLTQTAGWPIEQVQQFMDDARDAIEDLSTRAYLDVTVVYGRKT